MRSLALIAIVLGCGGAPRGAAAQTVTAAGSAAMLNDAAFAPKTAIATSVDADPDQPR